MTATMPAPVFLDLTHTSHTRARTGIQRVTRSLHAALGANATAITHDPYLRAWRPLEPWERANLQADAVGGKRGLHWPFSAKLRGQAGRLLGRAPVLAALGSSGIVVPEIFSPTVAAALPAVFAATRGPRVAVFHDAIPLKLPELTPARTVARFPAYLQELLAFDGIAAVSDDSRDSLVDYWRWLGVARTPPVRTVALGIDRPAPTERSETPGSSVPVVLSVGSIEGRKNHLALLEACERLWRTGLKFELQLIGLAHPQTGRAALARIRELQAGGRLLRYDGPASDAALEAAYAGCAFTVYPSVMEGFGLPVIESVAREKPCICSAHGAVGESARDGGCVALERVGADDLAPAIRSLLADPAGLAALQAAARARPFRSWQDYAADLLGWLHELPRRA